MTRLNRLAAIAATALAVGSANSAPTIEGTLTLGNQAPVLCTMTGLAKAFAPNFADGTVSVVDLDARRVVATVPVGPNPRRLACNEATRRVYVVHATTPGSMTVLDAATHAVLATVAVGNDARNITANFLIDEVYVSDFGSSTLSIVSTASNSVVATLPVGTNPAAPASNDRLRKTYVPSAADGTVSVIDQRTRSVTATIRVGTAPQYATVDGQHGKVYVNNVADRTVSVIDSATDRVVKTLPSGAGTSSNFGVANALYRRYYLPNATDNSLTVIDTDTDSVVKTIPVGTAPVDVLADGGTGDLYVVNQGGDSVTVINAASEVVIGNFAVGDAPGRIYEAGDLLLALNGNGASRDTLTLATKQNTIAGTAPLYRVYNNSLSGAPNHRYTASRAVRDRMVAQGWEAEGNGVDVIFACMPPVSGRRNAIVGRPGEIRYNPPLAGA